MEQGCPASRLQRVLALPRSNCLQYLFWPQVFGMVIAWPAMVGGTAVATYLIVTNQEAIAARCGFGLAATLLLSGVSIASGMLVHFSVTAEGWHPRLRLNVRPCRARMHAFFKNLFCPHATHMSPSKSCCK